MTFSYVAPKRRSVLTFGVEIIRADGYRVINTLAGNVVSTGPLSESVKAGCSKEFRVRECVNGDWQFRLRIHRSLGLIKQLRSRAFAFWRERDFAVWTRNYLEPVVTLESVMIQGTGAYAEALRNAPPPPPPPLPTFDSFSSTPSP